MAMPPLTYLISEAKQNQTSLVLGWEMQQLEPEMEQWTGSKLVKEFVEAVYCHPAYITYMQSTSCEMPGRMKLKLESKDCQEKYQQSPICT